MKKTVLVFLFFAYSLVTYSYGEKATITESTVTMKTYGFSDPNPIANPSSKIYPYWKFSQYENISKDKEWKTIVLENEYIKVTLFPEIGGKVWGAIDKTKNKEFIYYNHVVKFRDIAMRGAWTSGGIEFNFGIIGHIPTTATPVNYKTEEKPDGSVSCYISSYELLTRTFWTVEVNLPSDKAYFSTSVTWSNTSALEQPYYQWMNAAFKADGNIQICSPGNSYIGHGGDAHNFPIDDKGHNLKKYSEMTFGHDISIHILGEFGNYYGAYWTDDDFGYAHCCRQDEKLGRKFFSWSQAREGEIWKDLLTDTDGQYIEIQSGRMFNQPVDQSMLTPYKHHSFIPMGTDKWTEYWYPIENIGPYNDASKIGAMTVNRLKDSIEVLFSPTTYGEKEFNVINGTDTIYKSSFPTTPLSVVKIAFPYKGNDLLKYIIGNSELVYDENPKSRATERPLELPQDFDWGSAYGHYIKGKQFSNIKYYREAEKHLDSALAINGYLVPALNKRALLELHMGRPESSVEYLRKALAVDTYDGEANYLWGIANFRLQKNTVAKDGFSVASYTSEFRSASYTMLASIAMNERNWTDCTDYIEKALNAQPDNLQALLLKIAYLRITGKQNGALINSTINDWPLNPIVRYEQLLAGDITKEEYLSKIRCEMPEQDLIEAALWYTNLGLTDEAVEICDMTTFPIAKYIKGYILQDIDKDAARTAVIEANSASVYLVFPYRQEIHKMLEWAESISPSWRISYYKSLLEWNRFDTAQALNELNKCDSSDYAPLFAARASLKSGQDRLQDLLTAEKLDNNWRIGDKIIAFYSDNRQWEKACYTAEKYFKLFQDKYEIGLKYANALCESGQYEKCLKILKQFRVMPNEGARTGHIIYRKANLRLACELLKDKKYSEAIKAVENSKIWDENLGVGKPYEALIDYTTENMIINAAKEKNWQMADSIFVTDK